MLPERLAHLEKTISDNQRHFYDIGKALKEIKDDRLYKLALFDTFEAYTKARWDMGRAHAYRLIDAYKIISNLSPIGDILPANESQLRPLVRLTPAEQRKLWKGFLGTGREVTALNVKKFITAHKITGKQKPRDLTDRVTKEYMSAVKKMLEQIQIAQNDQWQTTSRQAALLWHRVIREKILSKHNGHETSDDG